MVFAKLTDTAKETGPYRSILTTFAHKSGEAPFLRWRPWRLNLLSILGLLGFRSLLHDVGVALDEVDGLVDGQILLQVIESMEAEIPQAMYDARMDEMVNDFAFRVEQQGLRLEDYLKYMGQTVEQFRASFMPQAEKQVKIRLALEAVAAAENIEASEEEVSAEIKRIADQYKMEEDKVRELVNVDDLKKDLAVNKAIDFIKSHANVVEKAAEAEKTEDAQ